MHKINNNIYVSAQEFKSLPKSFTGLTDCFLAFSPNDLKFMGTHETWKLLSDSFFQLLQFRPRQSWLVTKTIASALPHNIGSKEGFSSKLTSERTSSRFHPTKLDILVDNSINRSQSALPNFTAWKSIGLSWCCFLNRGWSCWGVGTGGVCDCY